MTEKDLRARHLIHPVLAGLFWFGSALSIIFILAGFWWANPWLFVIGWVGLILAIDIHSIEPYRLTIHKERLALVEKPTEWIRIVFLSDFHADGKRKSRFFQRVVKRAKKEKPDLLIVGGDLVEEYAESIKALASLKQCQAPLGKFFVLGNHDGWGDPGYLRKTMEEWGWKDLSNKTHSLTKGDRTCELLGLDDMWLGAPKVNLLRKKQDVRILITHEIDLLEDVKEGEADVAIVGHTHGGQLRLPWVGPLFGLPQRAPIQFDRGKKMWGKMPVIISQGLGESNFGMRLFCPPQILIVELGV